MFFLKSTKINYGINIPTDISEITPGILDTLTSHIQVAPYHVLIANVMQTSLFQFVSSINDKKAQSIKVIPLIAKVNNPDLDNNNEGYGKTFNPNIGDRALLMPAIIEHALHVFIPTVICSNSVFTYLAKDEALDKTNNIRTACFRKEYAGNLINKGITNPTKEELIEDNEVNLCIVEFKVVPLSSISGTIPREVVMHDPFKVVHIKAQA